MPLQSRVFSGDPALEACLVRDNAHVTQGARGQHVARIQAVVMFLDGADIAEGEIKGKVYGPSTAAAVLAYKSARDIVNTAYQSSADAIVGKMTIKAMDDEMRAAEVEPETPTRRDVDCSVQTVEQPGPAVSGLQHRVRLRRVVLATASRTAALTRGLPPR